jgi:hypothetical protein
LGDKKALAGKSRLRVGKDRKPESVLEEKVLRKRDSACPTVALIA